MSDNVAHYRFPSHGDPQALELSPVSTSYHHKQFSLGSVSTVTDDLKTSKENAWLISRDPIYSEPSRMRWPQWPTYPKRSTVDTIFNTLTDVVLFSFSALFIIFAILVRQYDGVPVSTHRELTARLLDASRYGPTFFPILFATVIGRATKACMCWRLECGEKLGILDILASSTTVVNAVLAQIALRTISIVGCVVAIMWLLSPLGSQASLQAIKIVDGYSTNTSEADYMSSNSSYYIFDTGDTRGTYSQSANGLYVASLLSSGKAKSSSVDLWNNVKIPMVEYLENSGPSEWIAIPAGNVTYASLVGLPTSQYIPSAGTTSYVIDTAYWVLECPTVVNGFLFEHVNLSSETTQWSGKEGMSSTLMSNSSRLEPSDSSSSGCERYTDTPNLLPRTVVYNAWCPTNLYGGQVGAVCSITTSYVEVNISCQSSRCAAEKIRRSSKHQPPMTWTYLDDGDCTTWVYFAQNFVSAIDSPNGADPTLVQGYLANPDAPGNQYSMSPPDGAPSLGVSDTGSNFFALRLAQLLNTYWLCALGNQAIPNGLTPNTSALWSELDRNDQDLESGYYIVEKARTDAKLLHHFDIIKCHDRWFSALLVTSLFLTLCTLIAPAVRFYTRTPTICLTPSTMLRDNLYFGQPPTGSTLDSADRSRLLKDIKVRYGDVAPDSEVGHIAIGSVGEGRTVNLLQKGRLYD